MYLFNLLSQTLIERLKSTEISIGFVHKNGICLKASSAISIDCVYDFKGCIKSAQILENQSSEEKHLFAFGRFCRVTVFVPFCFVAPPPPLFLSSLLPLLLIPLLLVPLLPSFSPFPLKSRIPFCRLSHS